MTFIARGEVFILIMGLLYYYTLSPTRHVVRNILPLLGHPSVLEGGWELLLAEAEGCLFKREMINYFPNKGYEVKMSIFSTCLENLKFNEFTFRMSDSTGFEKAARSRKGILTYWPLVCEEMGIFVKRFKRTLLYISLGISGRNTIQTGCPWVAWRFQAEMRFGGRGGKFL